MLDHVGLAVKNYAKSKAFYVRALAPLGIELVMELGMNGGFGEGGQSFFWVGEDRADFWKEEHRVGAAPVHVAFKAKDRAAVEAFHRAALEAGGIDNGPPGIRRRYHPNYYAAFVIDPDGNNIEALHCGE
jgi:catechol 2,3-dioxygenase-like lactoylglutathione lyase family enzyme